MKTHTITIVTFLAAALAVAAILVTSRSAPSPVAAEGADQPILATLNARINDASEVRILRAGQTYTFRRASDSSGGWLLSEKNDYPVKAENVRSLLIGLVMLKAREAKTSKPELYSRIGVQDPAQPAPLADSAVEAEPPAQPALITVRDAAGAELASVIVGTQKWSGGGSPEVYVRKPGEAQSWLAAGKVDVPWDALAWVDRSILNIPREKWKSVTVTHPDGEIVGVIKADPSQTSFLLEHVPDGRQTTSPAAGDNLGSVFTALTLDDVRTAASLDSSQLAVSPRTVGMTFDGLVMTARTIELDGRKWTVFEAAAEKPDERPESSKQADELNAKLSPWAFVIPEYKSKALLTRWNDVLKPEDPAAPTQVPSEGPTETPAPPAERSEP